MMVKKINDISKHINSILPNELTYGHHISQIFSGSGLLSLTITVGAFARDHGGFVYSVV